MNAAQPRMTGLPGSNAKPRPSSEGEYSRKWLALLEEERRERGGLSRASKPTSRPPARSREGTVRIVMDFIAKQKGGQFTSSDVASSTGFYIKTISNVMKQLFDAGHVTRKRKNSKSPYVYRAVRK